MPRYWPIGSDSERIEHCRSRATDPLRRCPGRGATQAILGTSVSWLGCSPSTGVSFGLSIAELESGVFTLWRPRTPAGTSCTDGESGGFAATLGPSGLGAEGYPGRWVMLRKFLVWVVAVEAEEP